jgi:tetratricopeptide (TPR) repeat protein
VTCFTLGDYRRAEDLCRKGVQSLADDPSLRFRLTELPASGSRYYLALTLAERGQFREGITHGQDAIRLSETADHPFSLVIGCWALAYLYGLKGELSHAVRLLERSLALCREWNLTVLSPRVTGFLGSAYARSQRIAEGLSLLHQALKAMEALGIGAYHSLLVVHLGEACLLADLLEEALGAASRALTLARDRGERGHEAYALRLLGEIASHRDPPDIETAEGYYRHALALAEELGMRPLVAHCHLGLGALYPKVARLEQARAELSSAFELFRSMEMTSWLSLAEAALAKVE